MSGLTLPIQIRQPLNPYLGRLCSSFLFETNTHQRLNRDGLFYMADIAALDQRTAHRKFSNDVYRDLVATMRQLKIEIGDLPVTEALNQNFFELGPLPGKIPTTIREVFAKACNAGRPANLHSPSVLAVAIHPNLRLMADQAALVNGLLAQVGLRRPVLLAQIFQHTP
ncbi:TPA: hypothetical protein DEP96_02810 [Candidatus Uhrbacteria bacterium]|nr:hypothetical protein [Candidatus Uhrbacteria bacterium]